MEHTTFLRDLTILFGAAVFVSYLFHAARLPTITGFLVAGAIIGPSGLALIASIEEVQRMEQIGVMLLLFSIGVEFSTEKIRKMRWAVLGGGSGQVLVTGLLVGVSGALVSGSIRLAVFLGMLTALSSTVIGLRLLHERGQSLSAQGSVSLAILVFQDIAVLPMMLFLPFVTGRAALEAFDLARTLTVSVVAIVVILFLARAIVPRFISRTVEARSRDIFILSVILTVVAIAWTSSRFGISEALGAFVAGLVISESEYSHQVLSDVLPFRETFNSLFFVSIGMLLDPRFIFDNALTILGAAIAVMAVKAAVTTGVVRALGFPLRIAVAVGLLLAQIGEFSIVLLRAAQPNALVTPNLEQLLLATILFTMVLSPVAVALAERLPGTRRSRATETEGKPEFTDHTLIVGYGLNGKNVALLLEASKLPYVVLDLNPKTVKTARAEGVPIHYGDAISDAVLERVGARRANSIVFAISDPVATRRGLAAARQLNPSAFIIARTRFEAEIEPLYEAGADTVVTEEFETSLTIIRRLLDRLGIHPSKIDEAILSIRQHRYEPLRGSTPTGIRTDSSLRPFEAVVRNVAAGSSIGELGIRAKTGATLIAVQRGEEVFVNPAPDFVLQLGDHVHLIGSEHEVGRAMTLL